MPVKEYNSVQTKAHAASLLKGCQPMVFPAGSEEDYVRTTQSEVESLMDVGYGLTLTIDEEAGLAFVDIDRSVKTNYHPKKAGRGASR